MWKWILLGAASMTLFAGSAAAQAQYTLDLSNYPKDTPVSSIVEEGFEIDAGTSLGAIVRHGEIRFDKLGPDDRLVIKLLHGSSSSSIHFDGHGHCNGSDRISWRLAGAEVHFIETGTLGFQRCSNAIISVDKASDEIVFTVSGQAPNGFRVWDISYVSAAKPAAVPSLSGWAMIGLGGLIASLAVFMMQRRRVSFEGPQAPLR